MKRALVELEERIGLTPVVAPLAPLAPQAPQAPQAVPADVTPPRGVAADAPFDVAALQKVLDGEHAATRNEVRRLLDDPDTSSGLARSGASICRARPRWRCPGASR